MLTIPARSAILLGVTIQEHSLRVGQKAAEEAFRYARAVPPDRLDWKPMDVGQSVMDMCRELAMTPTWAADVLENVPHEFTEASLAAVRAEMASFATIDDCVAQWNSRFTRLEAVVLGISEAKLGETRWLPYEGGRDFTYLEMLEYPRWNCTYHLGQIAYVQTLYGDRELH